MNYTFFNNYIRDHDFFYRTTPHTQKNVLDESSVEYNHLNLLGIGHMIFSRNVFFMCM